MPRLPIDCSTATGATMQGRTMLAFAGCNYLGLANDPRVLQAVRMGLDRYGLSTTASRETTGNTTAFDDLETALSQFLSTERSLLLADGYTANIAMAQALATRFRTVLIDAKSHHSVHDAARSAGLVVVTFPHGDTEAAAVLARRHADADPSGAVAILTDGVFTSDGAIAKLPALLAALPNERSLLVVDDCHGVCVLGPEGRGTVSHYELTDPRIIITTTLAKGLGSYGGCIAGAAWFVELARSASGIYRCSTPIPPAIAMAAHEALRIVLAEPERIERLRSNTARLRGAFEAIGLPLRADHGSAQIPIFAFVLDTHERMESVHRSMLDEGILAPFIRYPNGPADMFFRIVVNAAHTTDQIDRLADAFARRLPAMGLTGTRGDGARLSGGTDLESPSGGPRVEGVA
ncbi:MAG: aminotransferase class I/II-fold pyridoxal phosphate-dependent enzyme [Phycisphaeraceae bacterium]|nr:aminotransferase class I/II-fold pyridoxal phosphate-dependent enzyme [Phycisphaeraceae bacterium]